MYHFALLNSPLHSTTASGPADLLIPSIAGLGAVAYGLWMLIHPDRCIKWFEDRLNVLGDNPYHYDPVRLQSKRTALMKYVYAKDPIKKIRWTGICFICGAVLFELIIWLFYLLS